MAMHLLRLLHFTALLMLCVFSHALIVDANEYYYTVDTPYREMLQEQYTNEDEDFYEKKIKVDDLRSNYLRKKNEINNRRKNMQKEQELKKALATTADTIGIPIETKEQQRIKDVFTREVVSPDEEGERIRVINSFTVNDNNELGVSRGKGQPVRTETVVLLKKRKKLSQTETVSNTSETVNQTTSTTSKTEITEQSRTEEVQKTENNTHQDSSGEKQPSKRDLMLQGRGLSGGKNEEKPENISTKTSKGSWFDSWLVYKDVKPMDYIGAYSIFKLLLTWPAGMEFSSNEVRMIGSKQISAELFSGKASMGFMPAFFISAGNDRFKFWRWEVELGYIPLRVSKINSLETNETDNPDSSFIVSNKNLGTHLMNLNFNNYIQFAFFDKSIVAFLGVGLGIGYAWSFDKDRLSSNFVLPVINAYLGVTFMISKTRKMNISYRLSYVDFSINNKYAWPDGNKVLFDSRPIIGGKTHFKDLFISAISIEYMFYIN